MSVLELINQTDVGFEPRKDTVFGKLELYLIRVSHTTGSFISIPGVQGGQFKEKDTSGNLLFKGLSMGGPNLLMVQVLTKRNASGEEYQIIKQYRSKEFSKATVQRFEQFGLPSVKSLFGDRIDDYMGQTTDDTVYAGKPAWVRADEVPTGEEFNGNPVTYWDFQELYSNEEVMQVADEAFWVKLKESGSEQDDSQEVVTPDTPVELATPPTGGWTAETWKDLGVSTVLGYKKDGRESAEIASMMVVGPEFVDEVLEKFPF